jgi:Phage late-transcription coactivator
VDRAILTKSRFATIIEEKVKQCSMSYMEAVIACCEDYDIELEDVRKFIGPIIKGKLEAEAKNLNFLPREGSLPI